MEEAAAQAGLGYFDIAVTIIAVIILLLAAFSFVFLAMAAWSNETDFITVIRSLIVTLMGGVVSLIRPNRDLVGDNPEEQRKKVQDQMANLRQGDGDE